MNDSASDQSTNALNAGGRSVWLVDPASRSVAIRRADGSRESFSGDGILTDEFVLPGFTLSLLGFSDPHVPDASKVEQASMTIRMEITETPTALRDLVARVQAGDEVEIAEGGRVLAKLISFEAAAQRRGFGMLKGRVWMSDDFDAPLNDEV